MLRTILINLFTFLPVSMHIGPLVRGDTSPWLDWANAATKPSCKRQDEKTLMFFVCFPVWRSKRYKGIRKFKLTTLLTVPGTVSSGFLIDLSNRVDNLALSNRLLPYRGKSTWVPRWTFELHRRKTCFPMYTHTRSGRKQEIRLKVSITNELECRAEKIVLKCVCVNA